MSARWIRLLLLSGAMVACDSSHSPGGPGAGSGVLSGEVRYGGASRAPLKVAVFDAFPPRGAPVAFAEYSAPAYPQAFVLRGLPSGRYFLLAVADADRSDGEGFRPQVDPGGAYGGFASPVAITVDAAGAAGVVVDLQDPSADSPWSRLQYR